MVQTTRRSKTDRNINGPWSVSRVVTIETNSPGDSVSETRVAVLVGSLRADSVNRKLAELLRDQAPAGVTLDLVDGLADLPFYNEDLDHDVDVPQAAAALRARVGGADRVLAVTPEYNGTMPAVLNNAIDWLSRPYGLGALTGKPFGVIGATPTPYGGKWSHADACLLYTSPSPRDGLLSRMPSSA